MHAILSSFEHSHFPTPQKQASLQSTTTIASSMAAAQLHARNTPTGAPSWANTLPFELDQESSTPKITNLQFYPSAIKVAENRDTWKSLTLFGSLMMADDPLIEGSDPNSKLVGWAQGLFGSASQHDIGLIMALSFGFVDGDYSGSSVSVLGRNSAASSVREMPVVGGTGIFRLGRGYAVAETYWLNVLTGDAIVHYNVTVVHY